MLALPKTFSENYKSKIISNGNKTYSPGQFLSLDIYAE